MRDGAATVFFIDSGFVIVLAGVRSDEADSTGTGVWAAYWELVGAAEVSPQADGELPGRVSHFKGDAPGGWRTGLPTYSRAVYPGVYPGIDLVVEPARHGVAYRFDVAPTADPRRIGIRWRGVDGMRLVRGGRAMEASIGSRVLVEQGLRVFGPGGDVSAGYRAPTETGGGGWQLGFVIQGAGPRERLVVDPTISWSSFLGGSGDDSARSVALDSAGNTYVTGFVTSSNFPVTAGFQPSFGGGAYDAFVTKISAAGRTLAWSSYLGGSGRDLGQGITVDAAGNVYVTGETGSSNFPTVGGFQTTYGGSTSDAFVTKIDAAGTSLAWSSYLGGNQPDWGEDVAVDASRNVYVTGVAGSTDFPAGGGFQSSQGGARDAFVSKVNAAGSTLAWSSYLGGSRADEGRAIEVDASGAAYLTGYTESLNFPSSGGFQVTNGSGADAFVAKVTPAGSMLAWSSYLGGLSVDYGKDIAVDASGSAYVVGETSSPTTFPTNGGFQITHGGSVDAFVTKVNPPGSSLAWSSFLGGSLGDFGEGVAVDASGDVYVIGTTLGGGFPTSGAFQNAKGGGTTDAFLAKVNGSGSAVAWSSYLGGSGNDEGMSISADVSGRIHAVGSTSSPNFPSTSGFQTTLAGGTDVFVTQIGNLTADGAACSSGSQCASGSCVGSVCCASECGACGDCSTGTCRPRSAATVCRAAAGDCDAPENCTGDSPVCPEDAFVSGGTTCRAAAGACDVPESCAGSATCPSDLMQAVDAACPDDGNPCTADVCDGVGSECGHPAGNVGVVCRAAAGECDVAEACTGDSTACPDDSAQAEGVVCAPDENPCTRDACDGVRTSCQHPAGHAGLVCRAAAGECDAAEVCSGDATACPDDSAKVEGVTCTPDQNPCTRDVCDGVRTSCQHPAGHAGVVCREAVGGCDAVETCDGSSVVCPADAVKPAQSACEDDGLACTRDVCDGASPACTHPFAPPTLVCRESVGECDVDETCTGSTATCPDDHVKAEGVACADDANPCTLELCNGSEGTCSHAPGNAGAVCRPSTGECDPAEICSGTDAACPGDERQAAGTTCADDGNPCTADVCDGASATCTRTPGNAGAVCRASAGACDVEDTCDGHSSVCHDVKQAAFTSCEDDGLPCTQDMCDGTSASCRHPPGNVGVACRPAGGPCDVEDTCDGASAGCSDAKKAVFTPCLDDGNACTSDFCDGASAECRHPAGNAGAPCRAAAGECDVAEACVAGSTECPADAKVEAGAACTDDGNPCTRDACDGADAACGHPAANPGALCRPAAGVCDLDETCSGVDAACPADALVAAGVACLDDGNPCTSDLCTGQDSACRHAAGNGGALCRPAGGECDLAESCDGTCQRA